MTVSLYTKPGLDDVRAAQPQVAQEQNRGDAIHLRERVFAVAVFADSGGTEQPAIFVMLERAWRHAAGRWAFPPAQMYKTVNRNVFYTLYSLENA